MSAASAVGRLAAAHWALLAVCAGFLLAGALVFDDYSTWPDDHHQRRIARATLDYLAGDGERAFDQLLNFADEYYGAAFDGPLLLVERALGLSDNRDILLSRHLLIHLFFIASGVACYVLVLRLFNNRLLALVAMLLFLLHPRIYAHSFFNSKDVPFLGAFMISLYLTHRAFRRDTLATFLLCGVGAGILVNLRIMGVLLIVAVLALRALDLTLAGSAAARKRVLLSAAGFALAAALTFHASLPVLWTDPFGRLVELVRIFGAHPFQTYNLFRGEWLYSPHGLPFDYLPVWVGLTTPPATLLLALAGAVTLAWSGLRRPRDLLCNGPLRFGFLLLVLPVVTVVAVVVLENNVYTGWRQLYFLYAPLLLLAVIGLRWLASIPRGRWMRVGAYALAGAGAAVAVVSMVRIHPYEFSYFTALTDRTTPERLTLRYTINYWDQFTKDVLEGILDAHPTGDIFIAASHTIARQMLPRDDRERFINTRDFRSGERNFLELVHPRMCAPPLAEGTHVSRIYAATLYCVVDPVVYFDGVRRSLPAGEPLRRSVFDIYRDGRELTYVRDGCSRDDMTTSFFFHVVPVAVGDLPVPNRPYGFENLDHVLRQGSARIDGDCIARVRLPDYPIASVRTGQFDESGRLWEVEFALDGDAAAAVR